MKISQSLPRSEVEKIVKYFSFAEESGHVLRNSSTDARLFLTEEDFLSKVSNNTAYFENIRTLAPPSITQRQQVLKRQTISFGAAMHSDTNNFLGAANLNL